MLLHQTQGKEVETLRLVGLWLDQDQYPETSKGMCGGDCREGPTKLSLLSLFSFLLRIVVVSGSAWEL